MEELKSFKEYGVLVAVGVYLFKQAWELLIGSAKRKLDTLEANTKAIQELTFEVKNIKTQIEDLPKLRKDLDSAHIKIRETSKLDQ